MEALPPLFECMLPRLHLHAALRPSEDDAERSPAPKDAAARFESWRRQRAIALSLKPRDPTLQMHMVETDKLHQLVSGPYGPKEAS